MALLSACSDSASRITSPPLQFSVTDGPAAPLNFAVLANASVSCTNGTIGGDVGTFLAPPNGSVTLSSCPLTGTVHVGDAAAIQAFNDFLSTYAALKPQPGDICPIITGTLAGQNFAPGVYCVSGEAKTGVLTLTGPSTGTWIIKVFGALTGTNFSVVMAGGGQACNVTWWVSKAATMTTSGFQGSILAGGGITLTDGSFNGNASTKANATITGTAVHGRRCRT